MPEFVKMGRKRKRLTFGPSKELVALPYLVELQHESYSWFLQPDVPPDYRKSQGLQELLEEIFPIESYDGSFVIEFVRYYIDPPTLTEEEARQKDLTWSMPLRATVQLVNRNTGEIKEEEIFLGDFPVMTDRGSFIINGTERVVVNQLARSAGVYFSIESGSPGQEVCKAKIIPDRIMLV